ncbi:hypothetical protein GLE_2783 [Lysobacter enzymogenes]|uniref:Uncharacterized protein n=1 Tax=Lysobacter enzymogenes TaxID=69 RepID=A0A0S2DI48_LYSEN|nr:hypothetical protein GLE_2783 [Lysobacter enzymogenes]
MRLGFLASGQCEQQRAQEREGNRARCRFRQLHETEDPCVLVDTSSRTSPRPARPRSARPAARTRAAGARFTS